LLSSIIPQMLQENDMNVFASQKWALPALTMLSWGIRHQGVKAFMFISSDQKSFYHEGGRHWVGEISKQVQGLSLVVDGRKAASDGQAMKGKSKNRWGGHGKDSSKSRKHSRNFSSYIMGVQSLKIARNKVGATGTGKIETWRY
ncbi:hypothetical protein CU098_008988, partial [Rhizopus stolonifer]